MTESSLPPDYEIRVLRQRGEYHGLFSNKSRKNQGGNND